MKTTLVIFGMTGDLSRKKLLPAIEHIFDAGETSDLSIIGVSRRHVDVAELLNDSIGRSDLSDRFSIFTMNLADQADYMRLKSAISADDSHQVLIYLSVPPSAAVSIVDFLGQAGINSPSIKLLFEKPFGFDYQSAHDYIERTARYFSEDQIFRIDHYMAKDLAQHLIHERIVDQSNTQRIDSIHITATESIGIEGRAFFYEETGALRDFLQGHLLQILSLVLAEPSDAPLSERRLSALNQLLPVDPKSAVRAQYMGYQEEVSNPGSLTETFAAFSIQSQDPRWANVKISLATGKALDTKRSYVRIRYNDGTEQLFEDSMPLNNDQVSMSAYERVLLEAIKGNKQIFTTSEEVLRSWQLVAPVQTAWQMDHSPLRQYQPGSSISELITDK